MIFHYFSGENFLIETVPKVKIDQRKTYWISLFYLTLFLPVKIWLIDFSLDAVNSVWSVAGFEFPLAVSVHLWF